MEEVDDCYKHGPVFECSLCGGLTCAECEMIQIGDKDIDYGPVSCAVCRAKNVGRDGDS